MGVILTTLRKIFFPHSARKICDKVEELEKRSRETKHTLRNLAFRSAALHRLVEDMRGGEDWVRRRGDRSNDK